MEILRRKIFKAFSMFYERGIICFFTGKNPLVHWVAQWLNAMAGKNNVEDVYKGLRFFLKLCFEPKKTEIDYYHMCRFFIIVI